MAGGGRLVAKVAKKAAARSAVSSTSWMYRAVVDTWAWRAWLLIRFIGAPPSASMVTPVCRSLCGDQTGTAAASWTLRITLLTAARWVRVSPSGRRVVGEERVQEALADDRGKANSKEQKERVRALLQL